MRIGKRLLTVSLTLLGVYSLLGAGSCSQGPDVTVYISTPKNGGMNWARASANKTGFIPYQYTDKFVCFNQIDAQLLLDYCKASQNDNNN